MTERTKDFATFAILSAVTVALALGGTLWLGVDGRVPVEMTVDGVVTRSANVSVLWFVPVFTLALWGLGAPVAIWLSAVLAKARAREGAEDAVRGLARYRSALRVYAAGFTAVMIAIQLFVLARAAGIARPLGFDRETIVRFAFLVFGLLFAYIGNLAPKIPYTPNPAYDAVRHYKANRFAGLIFVLGGIATCIAAIAAPFDRLAAATGALSAAMIGLPLIRLAMLVIEQWRKNARKGCDPI